MSWFLCCVCVVARSCGNPVSSYFVESCYLAVVSKERFFHRSATELGRSGLAGVGHLERYTLNTMCAMMLIFIGLSGRVASDCMVDSLMLNF